MSADAACEEEEEEPLAILSEEEEDEDATAWLPVFGPFRKKSISSRRQLEKTGEEPSSALPETSLASSSSSSAAAAAASPSAAPAAAAAAASAATAWPWSGNPPACRYNRSGDSRPCREQTQSGDPSACPHSRRPPQVSAADMIWRARMIDAVGELDEEDGDAGAASHGPDSEVAASSRKRSRTADADVELDDPTPSKKSNKASQAAAASSPSAPSTAAAASSSAAPAAAAAAAASLSAAPAANNAEALRLEFFALEHPLKPADSLLRWSKHLSDQIVSVVGDHNWGSLCMLHQLLTCAKLLWDQTYSDPKWRASRFAADRLDNEAKIYRDLEAELKAAMDKAVLEGWSMSR